MEQGILFIVSTPIGNLSDITFRAIEILKKVDKIFCEDTRVSRKLLAHYGIKKQLISCHSYNEEKRKGFILEELSSGGNIAFITDSGSPGISDPGTKIIKEVKEKGFKVTPIPGPSAVTASIQASGIDVSKFTFLGFLPRKPGEIKKILEPYKNNKNAIIIFESAKRVVKTLQILLEVLENRRIELNRELTKVFEENISGNIEDVIKKLERKQVKGEITIVIEGNAKQEKQVSDKLEFGNFKQAIQFLSKELGIKKNELYNAIVKLKGENHQ